MHGPYLKYLNHCHNLHRCEQPAVEGIQTTSKLPCVLRLYPLGCQCCPLVAAFTYYINEDAQALKMHL